MIKATLSILSSRGSFFAAGYVNKSSLIYDGIQFGIIFSGLYLSQYIAQKYFKEPIVATFGIVFIITFFAHLYATINKDIHHIKNAEITDIKQYNFEFSPEKQYPNRDMILLASSNDFFIFRNLKTKQSLVLPRNSILSISSF